MEQKQQTMPLCVLFHYVNGNIPPTIHIINDFYSQFKWGGVLRTLNPEYIDFHRQETRADRDPLSAVSGDCFAARKYYEREQDPVKRASAKLLHLTTHFVPDEDRLLLTDAIAPGVNHHEALATLDSFLRQLVSGSMVLYTGHPYSPNPNKNFLEGSGLVERLKHSSLDQAKVTVALSNCKYGTVEEAEASAKLLESFTKDPEYRLWKLPEELEISRLLDPPRLMFAWQNTLADKGELFP